MYYIINNLVNPCVWWPCGIRTTVLFVGGFLPGKFQQVDSASATDSRRCLRVIKCQSRKIGYSYFLSCTQNEKIICFNVRNNFRSFIAETCPSEVALNRILDVR